MSFRSELFRNVRILGLISICFTMGVFAAEGVGNLLQPVATHVMPSDGGHAATDEPLKANSPSITDDADKPEGAATADLPEATKQLP